MMMSQMGNMSSMGSMNTMGNMNGNMGYAGQGFNHVPMQGFADPNAMAGMANHGYAGSNSLFGGTNFLGGLLSFAVEILALVVVIGLITGTVVFIKRYLFDQLLNSVPKKNA